MQLRALGFLCKLVGLGARAFPGKLGGERKEEEKMKKRNTLIIVLAAVMALLLSSVPVMASQDVETKVNVIGGSGENQPPIVQAMWVQDTTSCLEDGDPAHAIPGSQFNPPGVFEGQKDLEFWVIVTDPEGVSTIKLVDVNVYYPDCGPHKFQLILEEVDKDDVGKPAYAAAQAAGLVVYGEGIDHDKVNHDLTQCLNAVYRATGYMYYHQPAGDYTFIAGAFDNVNNFVSLESTFEYVAVTGLEKDFTQVNYGNVEVGSPKMVGGDKNFGTADKPTVRNIGNVPLTLMVAQDDMGFGFSGMPTNKQWNVNFFARLGSSTGDLVGPYDPGWAKGEVRPDELDWNILPNDLPLCTTEKMDFGIKVIKSTPAEMTGEMVIGWTSALNGD